MQAMAISGFRDYALKVWDVERGIALHTLEHHAPWVPLAISPDGKRVLSGSA
jgi:WD40 repeat protein